MTVISDIKNIKNKRKKRKEEINMAYTPVEYPAEKGANASAVLGIALKDINWVGFYMVKGEELVLGPFQGKPAVSRIGYGKGVCGTGWAEKRTQLVADVHCFAGHIACDCNSNAEIVVPLLNDAGEVLGVLDIDSPVSGRFDGDDLDGLEAAAALLAKKIAG